MDADVNAFVDGIIAEARMKIRTDLKNISSKAKRDFVDKAKETVSLYYAHYTKPPRIYERTNNLRDNVVDENFTFSVLNGSQFGAWVRFSSDNMSEYEMGNKDVVVANFMQGIHGKGSIFVEDNPAINLMNEFQENYKKTLDGYFMDLGYKVK